MDVILAGSAISLRQASHAASMIASEPVLAQILPNVLDRVQLGRAGRQEDRGDVVGQVELTGSVPSGSVEQQDGVGALGDVARDFNLTARERATL
jgi:hypothetical protein